MKRRPTSSTTWSCSCEAGDARSRTPSGCSMAVAPSAPELGGVGIAPGLEEARSLAQTYNLIPLRYSFIEDCETPVSALLKLRALAPGEPAFLLESADQGQRVGRWSFIGIGPRSVLRWSLGDGGAPYELASRELSRFVQAPLQDAPPSAGGAVGVFAADLVRTVEPLGDPPSDPLGLPDMALMLS